MARTNEVHGLKPSLVRAATPAAVAAAAAAAVTSVGGAAGGAVGGAVGGAAGGAATVANAAGMRTSRMARRAAAPPDLDLSLRHACSAAAAPTLAAPATLLEPAEAKVITLTASFGTRCDLCRCTVVRLGRTMTTQKAAAAAPAAAAGCAATKRVTDVVK